MFRHMRLFLGGGVERSSRCMSLTDASKSYFSRGNCEITLLIVSLHDEVTLIIKSLSDWEQKNDRKLTFAHLLRQFTRQRLSQVRLASSYINPVTTRPIENEASYFQCLARYFAQLCFQLQFIVTRSVGISPAKCHFRKPFSSNTALFHLFHASIHSSILANCNESSETDTVDESATIAPQV
jgi:hypothetical protein